MLKFFSFCCFIERISHDNLIFALKLLLSSLDYYVKEYEFILYTNFDINIDNANLKIRPYYDKSTKIYYGNNVWANLSFNKINIYKDLFDETKENYTWIDLDTIVVHDISYLENIDNFCIEHGGNYDKIEQVIVPGNFVVPVNKYIQGAIWKININLYNLLMDTLKEVTNQNLRIDYDIQGLLHYYYYKVLNGELDKNKINVCGANFKNNTINGLGMWSNNKNEHAHANIEGLKAMYWDNNILKTQFYDKEIHFVMFTFFTLNIIKDSIEFKELFGYLL